VVNSKTQVSFTSSALKFGCCLCFAARTRTRCYRCNPASGQCSMCWVSRHFIQLACEFGLPLGEDWGYGCLVLISNNFWTKTRRNFTWPILLLKMTEW